MTVQLPELLTVEEVAAYLKLHPVTVLRFARQKRLPGFKIGREWRFRADDIKLWLEIRSESREEFARRFESLMERIRQKAESAGYGPDDVPRLIEEVREARRQRRVAPRA